MERANAYKAIQSDSLKGDFAVVGASTGIIEQLGPILKHACFSNNVYFSMSWDRLKHIIDTVHLDAVIVDSGYGHVVSDIKSYCTIPVIHLYSPDSQEYSFADIRIEYSGFAAARIADEIRDMLQYGRDIVEFGGAVRCSELKVDMDNYVTTYRDGAPIPLKPMETRLLFYLMKLRNRVALKTLLAANVWDMPEAVYTRTIDVHIKNLRKKLNEYEVPVEISTIRQVGYRLSDKEMP